MANATAISELERAEHDGTFGVKKVRAYGSDGTNLQSLKTDTNGSLSIIQGVIADPNNSSTTNLASGATFTGTATETLGVAAVQVSLKTDQNCTIYVEQSPDGTNWDISDEYIYYYSINNAGFTVQAINSYVRVRVKNNNVETTSYFRLQTALCPVSEPLPRALNEHGRLKVATTLEDNYGFEIEATPMGEMRIAEPVRMVGANIDGTTVDPNFWLETNANNGDTTQANAEMTLATGTTANGSTTINSRRRARYVAGSSMRYRSQIQLGDTGVSDNKRRWGIAWGATMPTITDGAYFELNGTTFSVVLNKGGSETRKSSGEFNGTLGAKYTLNTNITTYEIYWTNSKVYFVIGDEILHVFTASTTTWSNTMSHYLFADNVNSNNLNTNQTLKIRAMSIYRLGRLETAPMSYYQSGTTAGVVLKYGAGTIHGLIVSGVVNNSVITLYDNTAASGTVIWSSGAMGAQTTPLGLEFHDISFSNGLTLVIGSANSNCLVIYE